MLQYILKINGMACSMCEAHVNDAIRQNFKVKRIRSSHAKGQCELTAEQELDEQKLKAVLQGIGYELQSVEKTTAPEKGSANGGFFARLKRHG